MEQTFVFWRPDKICLRNLHPGPPQVAFPRTHACRDRLSSVVTWVCHISPQCWPWGVLMLPALMWFHDTSSHAGSQRAIKTNTLLLWGRRSVCFSHLNHFIQSTFWNHTRPPNSPNILKFWYKRSMFWPLSDPSHPWQLQTEGSHEKTLL